MYKVNILDKISIVLIIIGALNWGIFGMSGCDLVNLLFSGVLPIISKIIYVLIGLSGINMFLFVLKISKDKI